MSKDSSGVFFGLTSDAMGGMQRVVLSLAQILGQQGCSATVHVPRSANGDALANWASAEGISLSRSEAMPDAAARHTPLGVLRLARLIRREDPAVVNLHYGDVFISLKDVLAVRASGRRRCVVSVHHPTPWSVASERKRRLTGLAGRLATSVVVTSGATEQLMREAGIPSSKLRRIPCGVPEPADCIDRAEARRRFGIVQTDFVVGTLARLVEHKDVDVLIEACARSCAAGQLRLLVAGDGPERQRLETLARERLGTRAQFLGRVDSASLLYAASDIFALPSRLEGFGLVYLEAAMLGVPAIATNVGGVTEAVVDGETGILIEAGDLDACVRALDALFSRPAWRLELGNAARQRAVSHFTDRAMAERYEQVLFGS